MSHQSPALTAGWRSRRDDRRQGDGTGAEGTGALTRCTTFWWAGAGEPRWVGLELLLGDLFRRSVPGAADHRPGPSAAGRIVALAMSHDAGLLRGPGQVRWYRLRGRPVVCVEDLDPDTEPSACRGPEAPAILRQIEAESADADALAAVVRELEARGYDAAVFDDSWNPDAHVELTLTVAECRALLAQARPRGGAGEASADA